jgi:hypothetical protein
MFAATDTPWAPWWIARTDDKKCGRLNIISHLLSSVPYESAEPHDIELPKRKVSAKRREPNLTLNYIPTPF